MQLVEDDRGAAAKGDEKQRPGKAQPTHQGGRKELAKKLHYGTEFHQVINHSDKHERQGGPEHCIHLRSDGHKAPSQGWKLGCEEYRRPEAGKHGHPTHARGGLCVGVAQPNLCHAAGAHQKGAHHTGGEIRKCCCDEDDEGQLAQRDTTAAHANSPLSLWAGTQGLRVDADNLADFLGRKRAFAQEVWALTGEVNDGRGLADGRLSPIQVNRHGFT